MSNTCSLSALISSALVLVMSCAGAHENRMNQWLVVCDASPESAGMDWLASGPDPALDAVAAGHAWQYLDDRLFIRNQDDYVDLRAAQVLGKLGNMDAALSGVYAHLYVWSPDDRSAELLLGASGPLRAWVNGKLVGEMAEGRRQPRRDEVGFACGLTGGWNTLLLYAKATPDIWGFYAKLAGPGGSSLDDLIYSADNPGGPLAITTQTLPTGYRGWPYVWLTINGIPLVPGVPSASPFRLLAKGGTPPYAWSIAEGVLPQGLELESARGRLTGILDENAETQRVVLEVSDVYGATARQEVILEVQDRPTKWIEDGKLAGLIHGTTAYTKPHGPPDEQAALMAEQGYVLTCPTMGYYPPKTDWPGWYNPDHPPRDTLAYDALQEYAQAFEAQGIRFGSYLNLRDTMQILYPEDETEYAHWAQHNALQHRYLRRLMTEVRPAALWLDMATRPAPSQDKNWGYGLDPLYSIVRALSPETLIIPNCAGNPKLDYRVGDGDLFSTEGHNDAANDPYWDRWPAGPSGFNPKRLPNEGWRYPFEGHTDWQEWTRVVVSMICEGYICNLDHSYKPECLDMHQRATAWLTPRWHTLKGTRPGPLLPGSWGYDAAKNGRLYLHVLRNSRGKIGLAINWKKFSVEPLLRDVAKIVTVPGGKPVDFEQHGLRMDLDLSGIELDPVDTILEVTFEDERRP